MTSMPRYFVNDKTKKKAGIFSRAPSGRPSSDLDYEAFLPIDHGWAWVICFASFLTTYLTGVAGSAISILFLEIVDLYHSSYAIASLSMTSLVLAFSIMTVVSSYLVPVTGERCLTILAGVTFASCSICIFFTTNIVNFILLSAVKGAAVGCIVIPVVSMLAKFFKKRLSLAMSISSSGFCVASITAPALIRALNNEYGVQGTYLILSGVELHMVVAGLLLRPLSWYRWQKRIMILLQIKNSTYPKTVIDVLQQKPSKHSIHSARSLVEQEKTKSNLDIFINEVKPSNTTVTTATGISTMSSSNKGDKGHRASNTRALYEFPTSSNESSTDFDSLNFFPLGWRSRAPSETRSFDLNRNVFMSMIMSFSTLIVSNANSIRSHEERRSSSMVYGAAKAFKDSKARLSDIVDGSFISGEKISIVSARSRSSWTKTVSNSETNTLSQTETSTLGQMTAALREDQMVKKGGLFEMSKIQLMSQSLEGLQKKFRSSSAMKRGSREFYCFSGLFKSLMMSQGAFVMLLWTTVPGSTNQYLFQYLPTIAEFKGATKEEAALFVTVCGTVDLYSRICVGLLADKYWLRPTQIVSFAQFCLGIICHSNVIIQDFNTLLMMGALMGIFLGTRSTLLPVMIVELLGIDLMPKALGIITMTTTFSSAFHGILLSSMIEMAQSIKPILHYVGLALMLSAIGIMMTIPLVIVDEETNNSEVEYIFKPSQPRIYSSPISFRRRGTSV